MLKKREIKMAIVEDDLYFKKSLQRYVKTICEPYESRGFTFDISTFSSANEAIQELDDELDIMILDYHLPDMYCDDDLSGEDVIKAVQDHCKNCKVILVSSDSRQLERKREVNHSIYGFVDKNINTKNRLGALLQETL